MDIEEEFQKDIEENMYRIAVRWPYIIRFVENQTERICNMAVKRDRDLFRYCKVQTFQVCLIAIYKRVHNLRYMHDQQEILCWKALEYDLNAIKYIRVPTYQMINYVIERDLSYLQIINIQEYHQSEILYWKAIVHDPNNIQFVNSPTEEMINYILEKDPSQLIYIVSEQSWMNILKKNLDHITLCRSQTVDMWRYIISEDENQLQHLNNKKIIFELLKDDDMTNTLMTYLSPNEKKNLISLKPTIINTYFDKSIDEFIEIILENMWILEHLDRFNQRIPWLLSHLYKSNINNFIELILKDLSLVKYINDVDILYFLVYGNPLSIYYMRNPTKDMIQYAASLNMTSIPLIRRKFNMKHLYAIKIDS